MSEYGVDLVVSEDGVDYQVPEDGVECSVDCLLAHISSPPGPARALDCNTRHAHKTALWRRVIGG